MSVAEPALAVDDIQGDILAGFRKDHVRLVFFRWQPAQTTAFKTWLAGYATQIASARQVSGFNQVFKAMRLQMGRDPAGLSVMWRNIAFTASGLEKLIGTAEVAKFVDPSFRAGAEALSATLGDPTDGSLGDPSTWLIGAGADTPDGVVILAADSPALLAHEVAALGQALTPMLVAPPYVEVGETRASRPGHEHFGFKDGISQPAVRGTNPDGSFFTPRYLDPKDPLAAYFAAPGLPLVWPGEFLLNGWKQKGSNTDSLQHPPVVDAPAWASNGSYLVFRRLRQDVAAFDRLVDQVFSALAADAGFPGITRAAAAAMVVGRFESGCPVSRLSHDDPALGADSFAANNFNFSTDTPPMQIAAGAPVDADTFQPALADRRGARCPFGSHIRKVNPRDDSTDFGSGSNNLQRRIMRRGIPYGPEYNPVQPDNADRGLLFLCYQASIEDQFQTLITDWVNGDRAPKDPSGFDPLISTPANRRFLATRTDGTILSISIPDPFVAATGAAFLFSPPISALRGRLAN